jgi:hypothetical protein
MNRPLQVYLDSSDYSEIAERNNKSNKHELENTYQFLLDARERGKIEIRYSSITILECIQQKAEHKEYALRRAQAIEKLSQGSVLKDVMTLHFESCLTALDMGKKRVEINRFAKGEHNQWYTDISPIFASYEKVYVDKINELIQQRPKSTRKQLRNLMYTSRGLSDYALERLRVVGIAFEAAFIEQFPMLNGYPLQRTMTQYLKKNISKSEIAKELGETVFNPINFTKWFVESINNQHPSSLNNLRKQGSLVGSIIESARAELNELGLQFIKMGSIKKDAQSKLKTYRFPARQMKEHLLDDIFSGKQKTLAQQNVSRELWNKKVVQSDLGDLLSIDFVSELFADYITKKIHDSRSKLAPSDFGDIQHCTYIPFVDIFRCDKRTAPLASATTKKYKLNTHIATNLEEVVREINNRTTQPT